MTSAISFFDAIMGTPVTITDHLQKKASTRKKLLIKKVIGAHTRKYTILDQKY